MKYGIVCEEGIFGRKGESSGQCGGLKFDQTLRCCGAEPSFQKHLREKKSFYM